jgi:hypothetical protein
VIKLPEEDKKVLENFVSEFSVMMESFMSDHQDYQLAFLDLQRSVEDLQDDTKGLLKTVRDGNGQPPLTTRLAVMEEKQNEIDRKISRWWALLLAAVPGLLAFLQNAM